MPHRQLIREIEKGEAKSLYLLHGEESFFIDEVADALENHVVQEGLEDFNLRIFYGKDSELSEVLEAARRFPMMADRQLVLVREAQDLGAWRRKEELEKLEAYAAKPVGSTVLAFCFKNKKADARLKAVKTISRNGVLFLSEKVRDYKLAGWIRDYIKSEGLTVGQEGAQILAESLGNDLSKVVNEIQKLKILLPAGEEVTAEAIEQHIGISKDFNVFELQRALADKNVLKANQIVRYFEANPKDHPLAMIAPVLGSFFSKVFIFHGLKDKSPGTAAKALRCAPFAVKQYASAAGQYSPAKLGRIFGYLREADRKSKGQDNVSISGGMLLREAVFKIMH